MFLLDFYRAQMLSMDVLRLTGRCRERAAEKAKARFHVYRVDGKM